MYIHAHKLMCAFTLVHTKNIIHVPKPWPNLPNYSHILSFAEKKKLEKYLPILIPVTSSHLTSLIWLPSLSLQQNCLRQGCFVTLLVSFSEPFSGLILSSQSVLTVSFSTACDTETSEFASPAAPSSSPACQWFTFSWGLQSHITQHRISHNIWSCSNGVITKEYVCACVYMYTEVCTSAKKIKKYGK